MLRYFLLLMVLFLSSSMMRSQDLENNKSVLMLKANILMEQEQFDDAVRMYNQIINQDDEFAAAYLMRAKAKFKLEAYVGAKKDMIKYISYSGITPEGIKLMSKTEFLLENKTAALNYATTAIEIDPYDAEQYRIAGALQLENKYYSEACELFTRAVRLGDSEAEKLYNSNCGLDGPVTASKRYLSDEKPATTAKPKETAEENIPTNNEEDTLTASVIEDDKNTSAILKADEKMEQARDLEKPSDDTEEIADLTHNDDLEAKQEIEIDPELSVSVTQGLGERELDSYPDIFMLSSEDGIVVVDVCVDNSGSVVTAEVNKASSTLHKPGLTSLAIRKSKDFTFFPSKRDEQCGWIVYHVKPSRQRP